MRHRFTVGAVTCFGLSVAIVALWGRSGRVADTAGWSSFKQAGFGSPTTVRELGVASVDGWLVLVRQVSWFSPGDQRWEPHFAVLQGDGWHHAETSAATWRSLHGSSFQHLGVTGSDDLTTAMYGRHGWQLSVPYGVVLAVTVAGMGGCWWRAARVGRSARVGLCRRCGYDLRGTPDRCPECGTINQAADDIGGLVPVPCRPHAALHLPR